MSRRWPYLWYNPDTGDPYDSNPNPKHFPKIPISNKTQRLREECISKSQNSDEPEFVFPNRNRKKFTQLVPATTKTQRLRQQVSATQIEERLHLHEPIKPKKINSTVLSPEYTPLIPPVKNKTQRLRDDYLKAMRISTSAETLQKIKMEAEGRGLYKNITAAIGKSSSKLLKTSSNTKRQHSGMKKKDETNNYGSGIRSQKKQANYQKKGAVRKTVSTPAVKSARVKNKKVVSTQYKKGLNRTKSANTVARTREAISRNRLNHIKEKMKTSNDSTEDVTRSSSLAHECASLLKNSTPNKRNYGFY